MASDGHRTAEPTGPTAGAWAAPPAKKRRRGGADRGRGDVDAKAPPPAAPAAPAAKQNLVCFAFNAGQCPGTVCPRSFVHRCSICSGPHSAFDTPTCKDKIDATGRPLKTGRKGGKGGKGGNDYPPSFRRRLLRHRRRPPAEARKFWVRLLPLFRRIGPNSLRGVVYSQTPSSWRRRPLQLAGMMASPRRSQ